MVWAGQRQLRRSNPGVRTSVLLLASACGWLSSGLLGASFTSPLSPSESPETHSGRRSLLLALGVTSASVLPGAAIAGSKSQIVGAIGSKAKNPTKPPTETPEWAGFYSDPQHPRCKRLIQQQSESLTSFFVNGKDPKSKKEGAACNMNQDQRPWRVLGSLKSADSKEITIDFSPKGGDAVALVGKWDLDGILFPDGNKW
eukprot:CAMPEP_0115090872 /NCGR_PEP_ID=MMETSP0227-20121206/25723_1 /TAXON_ID=89957 /ORGANISM="Polarella glacialis, Strain CCMP 1383" /LENGTH=199 /DNA_ID=CAMNT_0002482171 /DNA_START=50 /DNA_END=646 /DNA_ORIENTATION=-